MSGNGSARATAPPLGEPAALRLPPVQRRQLSNGLEVLIAERRELPVVDVQVVVRAGAHGDSAANAGRAALVAELLDQGTATRSATQIAEQAELLGASLHTRGSWDFCTAALHVLSPRLEPALDLLADAARNATFPEAELERKRHERLAAIMQELDEPRVLASHVHAGIMYGSGHPFGLPLGGTRESVERITHAGIREFYESRFGPDNAYMLLVGDVDADGVLPLLERMFGGWSAEARVPAVAHEMLPRDGISVHIVDRPGAPQTELRIGLPGPQRLCDDYFPLIVANTVLGGAFTSRLNMLLREEKAYTYGAGSRIAFRAGGGPFVASTAVFTSATADSVDTIVREVRRLGEETVPPVELDRAKNNIVLGLPRTFETTGDIAEHLSEVALYGLAADYYDQFADRVQAVSAADVQRAAARWLDADRLAVVATGDAAAIRGDLEKLGIGDVHEC
ncbi:hypothetical protein BH23GEM10_BH23GEM10_14920 [soil metagenome]